MRVDVKKFLFVGLEDDRTTFFQKAQELGVIHFVETKTTRKELPSEIANIVSAIKILRGLPVLEQEEIEEYSLADGLTNRILQKKNLLDKALEDERTTKLEIARVGVFGDFSKEDIDYIEQEANRKIQYFFGKHGIVHTELPEELIYIGTEHEMDYFFSINTESKQYPKLVEMKIDQPLGELQNKLENIRKSIAATENELKAYQKYNTFLHHALIHQLNSHNLHTSQEDVQYHLDQSLFAVTGWVPINKIEAVTQLVHQLNVHMEEVAVEPQDAVPTYLENKGLHRIGEDLVNIYDLPSITDRDPSIWVLFSFAFFFAFIVGDAGYGTVFLAIALYIHYRHQGLKGMKRRVLNLMMILAFACISWGFLTTSFFGITFPPDSPIRKVSLIHWLVTKKTEYILQHRDETYQYWVNKFPQLQNVTNPQEFIEKAYTIKNGEVSYELMNKFSDNIMFELALMIGVIHIFFSLLRYADKNWINIGWIVFLIGCYLYLPYYLDATSIIDFVFNLDKEKVAKGGLYMIIGGITFSMIISIFKNKILGIFEIMTVIQIFADVLSYLRLYALGLAGSIVTSIINETAAATNFLLGTLLFIVGNVINITLATMGGVIHGLRLNFLEWYHYSFEGGGKKFKPLQKVNIDD